MYIQKNFNNDIDSSEFKVTLSLSEKIKCLEEILHRLKKVLYVYDKSQEKDSEYNYKVFCGGILIYISSSNDLFDGELINIIINLNAILNNDFEKAQIKKIIFECRNQIEYMIDIYKNKERDDA